MLPVAIFVASSYEKSSLSSEEVWTEYKMSVRLLTLILEECGVLTVNGVADDYLHYVAS